MSARPTFTSAVDSRPPHDIRTSLARGACDARHLLHVLCGAAMPPPADALHEALERIQGAGDADRVRGMLRELQRRLERVA